MTARGADAYDPRVLPLSCSGTLWFPELTPDRVSNRDIGSALRIALEWERPSSVQVSTRHLEFTANMLRLVGRWNVLLPIERGHLQWTIREDGLELHYRLRFLTQLILTTVLSGVLFASWMLIDGSRGWPSHLTFALLAWLWIFGWNVLIARLRFPHFLRRAVAPLVFAARRAASRDQP